MEKRLLLKFSADVVNKPLTYNLIKEYDFTINILQAQISPQEEGKLIVEIENGSPQKLNEGINFLQKEGVEVVTLTESIIYNDNKCMDCGVCTGLCKAGALTLNEDRELEITQEKCTLCGLCADVCPVGALKVGSENV